MIGSHLLEGLAWCGSAVGALVLAAGAMDAASVPAHPLIAAIKPDEITAYTVAVCGALVTVANMLLACYQRLRRGRIDAATLEAAKVEALAKLVAARLRAKTRKDRKPKAKTNVDPTPKPDT